MLTEVNKNFCGDYAAIYTNIESLSYIPEINICKLLLQYNFFFNALGAILKIPINWPGYGLSIEIFSEYLL